MSESTGSSCCPFEMILGLPMVQVTVNDQLVWLILDTGANHTVLTPDSMAQLELEAVPAEVIAVGLAGSVGDVGTVHVESFRLAGVELGPVHLPVMPLDHVNHHLIEAGGPTASGVLGSDLLLPYRVTFDFPARQLELAAGVGTRG